MHHSTSPCQSTTPRNRTLPRRYRTTHFATSPRRHHTRLYVTSNSRTLPCFHRFLFILTLFSQDTFSCSYKVWVNYSTRLHRPGVKRRPSQPPLRNNPEGSLLHHHCGAKHHGNGPYCTPPRRYLTRLHLAKAGQHETQRNLTKAALHATLRYKQQSHTSVFSPIFI